MTSRLVNIALSQYGIKEVPGVENNPEIMKYFKVGNHTWVLGGNQSNMVRISAYPKDRILKYKKLWR